MIKHITVLISVFALTKSIGQPIDTSLYTIQVQSPAKLNHYFAKDPVWRGADGAASVDLGKGKVLWLFSDTFISDSGGSRRKSEIIRNSIAIQSGYDIETASLKYYWNRFGDKPAAFFQAKNEQWFWVGHGIMIKDRLLIFLLKEKEVKTGLGFETTGWAAVLILNPTDDPSVWKMKYIEGGDTYGTTAGSAAILKDDNYMYAYGAVEPGTHEVYLLRWALKDAYTGNLATPQWWMTDKWGERMKSDPAPKPLFTGATEYSVHYDSILKKYIQVQSFGFGESTIGMRMADRPQGPWSDPYMIFTPDYEGIKKPFMYSAKTHPELSGKACYITYNINSFDFEELLDQQAIYFPKFIELRIDKKTCQ
jgi:hypothetical protein